MSQKGLKVRDVPSHGSSVEPVTLSNAPIVLGVHIVFAPSAVSFFFSSPERALRSALANCSSQRCCRSGWRSRLHFDG